ncbi:unnamed protein product [Parascedosporium putredinis]|uniref:Uncharacterized protein n=1 Tax=Parascedosporium putredinis TaxID=1442378 RepID=A0A9P1H727_9PEZI|nr:unnamed protein product [Parascedosporium putredinis]CAI8001015.1 unnamed protein product [Parascedosporium putredinis]
MPQPRYVSFVSPSRSSATKAKYSTTHAATMALLFRDDIEPNLRHGNATVPVAVLQDAPADIAIGVEFKFVVPFLTAGAVDPCPGDSRPIAYTLHADSPDRLQDQAYQFIVDIVQAWAKQPAISIKDVKASSWQESDFWSDRWIVKKSNSAEPSPEERLLPGLSWAALEISSPRMPAHDLRTPAALSAVVRALSAHCRITVNYSCEMHTHLGRVDGKPFALSSLKSLAALCWLMEPALRLLKDPLSPNFQHAYTWSSPLQEKSRLATMLAEKEGNKPQKQKRDHRVSACCGGGEVRLRSKARVRTEPKVMTERDKAALRAISSAVDHQALGKLLSGETKPYRRLGFNFSAFGLEDERAGRSPRSVEVRFLEGCWGEREVLGWAEVCIALAVLAVEEPRDRFVKALTRLTRCNQRWAQNESRLTARAGQQQQHQQGEEQQQKQQRQQQQGAGAVRPADQLKAVMSMLGVSTEAAEVFQSKVNDIHR